MIQELVSFP